MLSMYEGANAMNSIEGVGIRCRRAQFMVIGQRREQVSLHSFSPSLPLSLSFRLCLSRLASSVFFYSVILLSFAFFALPSSSLSLTRLPLNLLSCVYIYRPLCSITAHLYPTCHVPHYQILP